MFRISVAFATLLFTASAFSQDAAKPDPFPKVPGAKPAEVKPADPATVPTLRTDQVYVVKSDVEFLLFAFPDGLVKLSNVRPGPVTIRGIFVDGGEDPETRDYADKFVAFVDAVKGASGRVELLYLPVGAKSTSDAIRQRIDVGQGPRPPPDIDPEPEPDPVPPQPTGFRVIMVYESSIKRSRDLDNILNSTRIREYLTAKCAKSTDNVPEWRVWDKDTEVQEDESKTIRDLWATVKPQLSEIPRLIIVVNGKAKDYPMPANEADTLKLLKSIGGE